MAKSKARRPARRKGKPAKKNRKRTKLAAKSRKSKRTKRAKPASRKSKRASTKKRQRTTAEGMRRALKLKQAAEQREHELHPQPTHNWPAQIPQEHKPDPVPNNLQEQGDLANILQNTNNRRAG
jgi:hypothetical protein